MLGQGRQARRADAPSSRDELFGLKPPRARLSRGEELPFSVSGFYDFLGAYTYSDPTHWSRAVNRLQLSAQGGGADVKWKIGGRFDIDPVYYWSDFYLDEVKKNQRTSAFWRETYLDFSAGGLDFRVGAQNIVWGEVVGLFFADVVSALDLREFLLPSFDIIRKPQWAARAEYFKGDSHVELVWIPFQTFDDIGKPGPISTRCRLPSPDLADRGLGVPEPGDARARRCPTPPTGFAPTRSSPAGTSLRSTTGVSNVARPSTGSPARRGADPFVFQPQLRPHLAGGRHGEQGFRRVRRPRRAGLHGRAGTSRPRTRPPRKACLRATPTTGSSARTSRSRTTCG